MKRNKIELNAKRLLCGITIILAGILTVRGTGPSEGEEIVVEETNIETTYTLTGSEKQLIADRIAEWNNPWKKVELNGKVIVDGLPVKPSLKIYMENNKKILISVRVVFVGEVARVEITPDEFILINKLKQTYFKGDPGSILEDDPTIISELQSLLLGRVALVGSGEFKADQSSLIDIVQQSANEFLVIPANPTAEGALNFGYSVSVAGQLEELIGVYSGFDGYVNLSYARAGDRLQIKGELVNGKRTTGATIQFDEPNWDAKGFSKMKIPEEYRQVGFREVLRLK